MQVIDNITQLQKALGESAGRIGFVPTMGYLHAGHLELVRKAKQLTDIVVVSIFVNPTQFGPDEDFDKYPRDLNHDFALLKGLDCDICFIPTVSEMYPDNNPPRHLKADPKLSALACGDSRPGHFDGVVTVVARLFDIVAPQVAFFGLKDYQQFIIIKQMTEDEGYPISIVGVPTVREEDGLALSSRNKYLTAEQRQQAPLFSKSLAAIAEAYRSDSAFNVDKAQDVFEEYLSQIPDAKIDYLQILNRETLEPVDSAQPDSAIVLAAVYIGKTRLIDNREL